jgi:hypothetical protein
MRGNALKTLLLSLVAILFAIASPAGVQISTAPQKVKITSAGAKLPLAPALHIVSDTALGDPTLRYAKDVRWANDHSVALAVRQNGVIEYNLDGKTSSKQLIPGENAPGGFWQSQHVAISSRYLVAGASLFALTWRQRDLALRKEEAFEGIHDLDVQGSRLAVVGSRRDEKQRFSPDGAIAWIGSLDKNLSDLKPLIFDARGPGAPSMNACLMTLIGATRFLADGSLWVVPGVQPGIYHFDPEGRLVQTLDTVALGIDTDCGGITKELAARMGRDVPFRLGWVNERRVVDEVLPLPMGPGLLIRSIQQGQVRWVLKVLHSDGSVEVHELPVRAPNLFAHLKGDFRDGRLALLLWGYPPDRRLENVPVPHLLIVSSPVS